MSLFDKFRRKKKERKTEVKIDTKVKRKELQIEDMLGGRYEIRDIKKGGMEGLKCY